MKNISNQGIEGVEPSHWDQLHDQSGISTQDIMDTAQALLPLSYLISVAEEYRNWCFIIRTEFRSWSRNNCVILLMLCTKSHPENYKKLWHFQQRCWCELTVLKKQTYPYRQTLKTSYPRLCDMRHLIVMQLQNQVKCCCRCNCLMANHFDSGTLK